MNAGLTIAYMGGWIDTKEMDRTSIGLTLKRSFAWGTWTWDLRIKLTGWYGIINFIELLLRLANFFCCESLLFSITICSCYEEKKRLCFTVMCKCFRAHHRHICKLGLQITVGRFWKYPGYLAPTWWSSDLLDSINYCLSVLIPKSIYCWHNYVNQTYFLLSSTSSQSISTMEMFFSHKS